MCPNSKFRHKCLSLSSVAITITVILSGLYSLREMGQVIISIFLLSISLLSKVSISHGHGLSRRFFLVDLVVDKLVPSNYKMHECMLCLCYKECHSGQFSVDEDHLCKDYVNSIKCSEVDRCSCCNDLALDIFKPCQHNGQCRNLGHGNFTCDCPSGHYGQRCELNGSPPQPHQTDFCASTPCQNGGVCSNGNTGFVCQCASGWTGQTCETDIDECATTNPCYNGGSCMNTQGTYKCNCANEWSGTNCETRSLLACDHSCALQTVVKSQPVENTNASLCQGTSRKTSNEALPMQCCKIGPTTTWHQGFQVLQHCTDNTIPTYTPVSEFVNGKVVPGKSGVFTSCLADGSGFKIIIQDCNASPQLKDVNAVNGENPGNYYAIY